MAKREPFETTLSVGEPALPTGGRTTTNDLYLLRTSEGATVLKVYRGDAPWRRRDHERAMLDLWDRHGFPVPRVRAWFLPGMSRPHLAISFVPGPSLAEFLHQPEHGEAAKYAVLGQVYRALRLRHERAIETGDHRLIHPDCNTGNVLLSDGRVSWIDLECESRFANAVDGAAAEICKLTRWIVTDLSLDSLGRVCDVLRAAYADLEPLLEYACRCTCDRPLQFAHRWRDRMRKLTSPRRVTVYDVVDGLRRSLNLIGHGHWSASKSVLRSAVEIAVAAEIAQAGTRSATAASELRIYPPPGAELVADAGRDHPVSEPVIASRRAA